MSALHMWIDRSQVTERLVDITDWVGMEDLTDVELVALLTLLEPAYERLHGHVAPVLRLATGGGR